MEKLANSRGQRKQNDASRRQEAHGKTAAGTDVWRSPRARRHQKTAGTCSLTDDALLLGSATLVELGLDELFDQIDECAPLLDV